MRWFWIDRFVEFEAGRRASALKCLALGEEQFFGYLPGAPLMPASLIVEGLAQTGGLLVGQMSQFEERVVLAKVRNAFFHGIARPGDVLAYEATLENAQSLGAIVKGTARVGERLLAEVDLVFAQLTDQRLQGDMFEPANLLRMLRILGLFTVGRTADGAPLPLPPRLLAAEQEEDRAAEPVPAAGPA